MNKLKLLLSTNYQLAIKFIKSILPHGPRGEIMAFFGMIYMLRGIQFLATASTSGIPEVLLTVMTNPAAIIFCGALWISAGLFVLVFSWHKTHTKSLGLWASFNFMWGALHLASFGVALFTVGASAAWYPALFFFGMAGVVIALARLINPTDTLGENHESSPE